jgi:hypothetical protein
MYRLPSDVLMYGSYLGNAATTTHTRINTPVLGHIPEGNVRLVPGERYHHHTYTRINTPVLGHIPEANEEPQKEKGPFQN